MENTKVNEQQVVMESEVVHKDSPTKDELKKWLNSVWVDINEDDFNTNPRRFRVTPKEMYRAAFNEYIDENC